MKKTITLLFFLVTYLQINSVAAETNIKQLEEQALAGNTHAQMQLAQFYATDDNNIQQDYQLAALWYRKAAIQGNAQAQYQIARFYEHGYGVEQSFPKAALWYTRSAKQTNPQAQYQLALMTLAGKGVHPDEPKAIRLLQQSAELGETRAANKLKELEVIAKK